MNHAALGSTLLLLVLAGCMQEGSGSGMAEAVVAVDYNDLRDAPTHDPVSYDPTTKPSARLYNDTDTPRPEAYNMHDLMVDWSRTTGTSYTVEHHAALGYSVTSIDGVVAHSTPGGKWHWALFVEGQQAPMDSTVVQDGAEYLWRFVHSPN